MLLFDVDVDVDVDTDWSIAVGLQVLGIFANYLIECMHVNVY